jgi:molecular chaperone HtpG
MTSSSQQQPATEQHTYKAEVERLLHLMVHSVYTEKEVFLRELIANASDALDKLRYQSLTSAGLMQGGAELAITLEPDILQRTLTIADNGIGMTRDELIGNLGTIAHSGTRAFLEKNRADDPAPTDDIETDDDAESKDAAGEKAKAQPASTVGQIGQFGIGFYSAFMVAERIEVRSRKAGTSEAWLWESEGPGGFMTSALSATEAETLGHGTRITLFLNDEALNYLEEHELERIVHAYSDHILFPICLKGGEGEPRQLNSARALWSRPRQEVTPAEYAECYRQVTHHFDEPKLTIHYRVEGRSEYAVLLFVPTTRPFDLFDPGRKGRVKLYVRRVFISDDADLLPAYLRFMHGVVDSSDMPLNISREMLQNNPMVASIRKALITRVLNELKTAAEKTPEIYAEIWAAFGAVLKEGLYEEPERRDLLLELARFRTTAAGEAWRSLTDYVAGLKENQTAIYYLIGDGIERMQASPQLEGFRARGIEVLLMTDPVDKFWVTTTLGFAGKQLRSITQGDADLALISILETADAPKQPAPADALRLTEAIKRSLGDAVSEVRTSVRLVDSAACLVAPAHGPDRGMEKMLERHAQGEGTKPSRPVLEINPSHAILQAVLRAADAGERARQDDLAWIVLDQARILEGDVPSDPVRFAERLTRLLAPSAATPA